MDLASKHPWKLMLRGTVLATWFGLAAVLLLLVGGRPLVDLMFGSDFLAAYPILLVLILVPLLGMISFPLPSMLYALDRPDAPLKARLVGTLTYFAVVVPLIGRWEVIGAAVAFVIGYSAMVAALIIQLFAEYRRVRVEYDPGGEVRA